MTWKTAAPTGLLSRFKKLPPPPKGLYIHGEVGRGKTMLMDLFSRQADVAPKRRVHFHAFMQDVHERVHAARQSKAAGCDRARRQGHREGSPPALPRRNADHRHRRRHDPRPAVRGLFARGVVIVTTSNLAPDDLYRDGLNRQLFLPFIELIAEQLRRGRARQPDATTAWAASRRMRPS